MALTPVEQKRWQGMYDALASRTAALEKVDMEEVRDALKGLIVRVTTLESMITQLFETSSEHQAAIAELNIDIGEA